MFDRERNAGTKEQFTSDEKFHSFTKEGQGNFELLVDLDPHYQGEDVLQIIVSPTELDLYKLREMEKGLERMGKAFAGALTTYTIAENKLVNDGGDDPYYSIQIKVPSPLNRESLYNDITGAFDKSCQTYQEHAVAKPDRQTAKISDVLAVYDGQTITPELRQEMAATIVGRLLARSK